MPSPFYIVTIHIHKRLGLYFFRAPVFPLDFCSLILDSKQTFASDDFGWCPGCFPAVVRPVQIEVTFVSLVLSMFLETKRPMALTSILVSKTSTKEILFILGFIPKKLGSSHHIHHVLLL